MIVSFGDKTTEDIFNGVNTKAARKISPELWPRLQSKLDLLNAGVTLNDLRIPPSNHLEKLRGDWAEFHSIRVNSQYRVVFQFMNGNATHVQCTDYH